MKALTIIQPFAELIASGVKRVENRTWYFKHRGPLAIHAGKSLKYGGQSIYEMAGYYDLPRERLALGAVIAVVDVIDCVKLVVTPERVVVPTSAQSRHDWLNDHEHTEGPYCFVLANVRRLARPLFMNGKQGPFDVDDAAIAAIGFEKLAPASV